MESRVDSDDASGGPRVFLCHASEDKAAVRRIGRSLRELGIPAWFDEWEIRLGDSLVQRINDGIEKCDVFLVFISAHSIDKDWVKFELSAILVKRIRHYARVIPVLLDGTEPPIVLQVGRWLEYSEGAHDDHIKELRIDILEEERRPALGVASDLSEEVEEPETPDTLRLLASFSQSEDDQEAQKRFQAFADFGIPTELRGSQIKEFVSESMGDLIEGHPDQLLVLSSERDPDAPPVHLQLSLHGAEGEVLAELPIPNPSRYSGLAGFALVGNASGGVFQIDLRFHTAEKSVNANLRYTADGWDPHRLLPVLRFFDVASEATRMRVTIHDGNWEQVGDPILETPPQQLGDTSLIPLVDDLAFVQRATGIHFAVTDDLTREDVEAIQRAATLLRGDAVEMEWTTFELPASGELLQNVADLIRDCRERGEEMCKSWGAEANEDPYAVEIQGHRIPLGRNWFMVAAGVIDNEDEVLAASEADGQVHIRVRESSDSKRPMMMRLVDRSPIAPPWKSGAVEDEQPVPAQGGRQGGSGAV